MRNNLSLRRSVDESFAIFTVKINHFVAEKLVVTLSSGYAGAGGVTLFSICAPGVLEHRQRYHLIIPYRIERSHSRFSLVSEQRRDALRLWHELQRQQLS